jgi:RNA polymerase sigma-70 factor (ECF subfamily)
VNNEADNREQLSDAETNPDALDRADMERLIGGHDAALNEIMERHAARLFNYLIRCLQNEEDAADAAQESFVRVYQNRAKFDTSQRFSTWLYTIASNLVKTRYRFRSRHPEVSLDAGNDQTGHSFRDSLPEQSPTPAERLQTDERADAVRRAIAALPEDLRTPLILAEYEERSQAEIGEILGCTAKAVETRIYRARQRLRVALGRLLETV